MSEHDKNQQYAEQTPTTSMLGELVYAEGGVEGIGVGVRLYRSEPDYGWVQWLRDGAVVEERRVWLRLGWEKDRAETDPYHWMVGFVDARTPDAPMTYVSRPIPMEVSQRMADLWELPRQE